MRTNERIEELKRFFHTTDERATFSVQNLAQLVASASKVRIQNHHSIWTGITTKTNGAQIRGASFQSSAISDRFKLAYQEQKPNTLKLSGNYRSGDGLINTPLEFHVPVAYGKSDASKFHFTTIEGSDKKPLLTIAKTANHGEPAKVVVTSHSSDGHRVAELLTRRLTGIATQFRGEDGGRLPTPEITLIKGVDVKLPEAPRKPTRREWKQKAGTALENLPELQAELAQLRLKLARKEGQTTRNRKTLRALIARHRQLKGELANEGEVKRRQIEKHADAVSRIEEIAELARKAKLGTRTKTLEQIREVTRRK